jgi:hypothetical protein
MMSPQSRIRIKDAFCIAGRGEVVFYDALAGEIQDGVELVSEQNGDTWHAHVISGFFDPPPPPNFVRPPTVLLTPAGEGRRIEPGEVFRTARRKPTDTA